MAIEFSDARWATLRENYRRWWAGDLERPLIQVPLSGRTPARPKPDIPYHHFTSFYDLSVPAARIVDWWEYNLETQVYTPDAFPHVIPYFGPGVAAAFLKGGRLHNTPETGTTWFRPEVEREARDLHLEHDPASPWWRRVCELYAAARDRFGGLVQLDMTDLGGNLDLVSTFRPGEKLLLDLYDCPDEVRRLTWEGHERWWEYFAQIQRICGPRNGYTAWASIYSEQPYYMLQCDFCYMIGPEMFDAFVKPELAACCRRLPHAFYHLDGPGQLPHLDSLLSIPELKGIQWVPGDGQPDITRWPEVYRRIRRAGKLIQIFQSQSPLGLGALDVIADQLGSAKGIIVLGGADRAQEKEVLRVLDRHGVS
jgi:5-methyltetrahydrofolate--homocysteine methyltransferase